MLIPYLEIEFEKSESESERDEDCVVQSKATIIKGSQTFLD